jgi:hypothetical protein
MKQKGGIGLDKEERREEIKKEIWELIKKEVSIQSVYEVNKDALDKETSALSLFPTHLAGEFAFIDEHANRYGLMIAKVWIELCVQYEIYLKMDYDVRTEFDIFPTLGHVYQYIYSKLGAEILEKGDDDDDVIY